LGTDSILGQYGHRGREIFQAGETLRQTVFLLETMIIQGVSCGLFPQVIQSFQLEGLDTGARPFFPLGQNGESIVCLAKTWKPAKPSHCTTPEACRKQPGTDFQEKCSLL
jgi:hypothetical protein